MIKVVGGWMEGLEWRFEWTIPLLFDFLFVGSDCMMTSVLSAWDGRDYSLKAIRAFDQQVLHR